MIDFLIGVIVMGIVIVLVHLPIHFCVKHRRNDLLRVYLLLFIITLFSPMFSVIGSVIREWLLK